MVCLDNSISDLNSIGSRVDDRMSLSGCFLRKRYCAKQKTELLSAPRLWSWCLPPPGSDWVRRNLLSWNRPLLQSSRDIPGLPFLPRVSLRTPLPALSTWNIRPSDRIQKPGLLFMYIHYNNCRHFFRIIWWKNPRFSQNILLSTILSTFCLTFSKPPW